MIPKIEIYQAQNEKGDVIFVCEAYGKHGEFETQLQAAEFAECAAEDWRREHGKNKSKT